MEQAPAQPAQSKSQTGSEAAPSTSGPQEPVPAAAQYNPNFKYSINNQEKEFDDWIRGAIKDNDTEAKARELYTKAMGLDLVKNRLHDEKSTRKQVEQAFQQLQARVFPVEQALQSGDLQSVFRGLNLTDEKLFQYVWNRLNYLEQPQEFRQAVEAREAAERRAMEMEQQFRSYHETQQAAAVQARTVELDTELEKPEIKTVAERFNQQATQMGLKNPDGSAVTFAGEVIKRGKAAYHLYGADISVKQAVGEVLAMIGQNPQFATQPQVAAPGANAAAKPPVIPTITGKAQSPVGKVIRSTDDLVKIRKEKYGS